MDRPEITRFVASALLATLSASAATAAPPASQCFGTVSKGRLENGVALPTQGANFSAYSRIAAAAGRTHVHSTVEAIVTDAYAALRSSQPAVAYVYGETGWADGGRIRPHRTHQNGLSVDFFVPVRDARGRSVALPTGPTNRFGYDIEFDADGRFGEYTIDFVALAEHLRALDVAARARGATIALVILDPRYLPRLFGTPQGEALKRSLPFMKRDAWVRHDEHYHVDFALPCKPLRG
ncbi:penicillin-insensitive murein endopeptidase [Aquabacterium humicola]|uniref:penicillin-insensitive murein endopeptidase n=1 Tax=Aquabacterium humicola TaxID=3237377 RepID=UPI0025438C5B|nr:penicillin-insensitive murein endopeptidase [Rubrivivax pictus]